MKIKMVDLKGREETLRKAYDLLKLASSLINICASGVEPYRISKLLNMMGKTTYDDAMVLSVLLGNRKFEDVTFELLTHSVKLLETQMEENPLTFRDEM